MAIRATDLTILAGLLLLTGAEIASSAERTDGHAHPVATDTRVGGDDAQTRFVMDFSQKVDLRAFTLADPYRVVIDLPQVTFNLPPKTGEAGRGLVKAFRFGLVMQGGSRIVMDVNKPVRIDKAFVIDAAAGQPARLVVDLAATDRDSFMKTLAAESRPVRAVTTGALEHESAQRAIRVRSSCSIPAMAASTTARSRAAARWKRTSFWNWPCSFATSSNGPANTAW